MSLIGTCSIINSTASNVQIKYELQNTTNQTLYVCHYATPLENLKNSHVFTVYNVTQQVPLRYGGFLVKRLAPTATNYLKIDPNETISNIVNMCPSYEFAPNEEYTVTAITDLQVIDDLNNLASTVAYPITSNTLQFTTN